MAIKALVINQETSPYVPATALAQGGRALAGQLSDKGYEIRAFMPKWGIINERRGQLHEVIRLSGMNIIINGNDHPVLMKVATLPNSRTQIYFIDNEEYFSRRRLLTEDDGTPCADNGERTIFFVRSVLEMVKKLRWAPDVILTTGWMSALAGLWVRHFLSDEPCFEHSKIIPVLFADAFPGALEDNFVSALRDEEEGRKIIKKYGCTYDYTTIMRLAIACADGIAVAEEGVASTILDEAAAAGKPLLPYTPGSTLAPYPPFIETLINKNKR